MSDVESNSTETKVIFRWFDGAVITLFPELPAVVGKPELCDSYMHIGQHGAADCAFVLSVSRAATEAEYAPLKTELENYPYEYRLTIETRL